MKDMCERELLIRRAAVEDRWTDALRQHVGGCESCAATAIAAPFMARLANIEIRPRTLPDPVVLWLKAQLMRGTTVDSRAARPLNIAQMTSYIVIAAGWAGLLTWKWEDVQRWLLSFTPANMIGEMVGAQSAIPATIVLAVVVLSSLTVMLALHSILAEE